jgi:hypothetical protein
MEPTYELFKLWSDVDLNEHLAFQLTRKIKTDKAWNERKLTIKFILQHLGERGLI